MTANLLRDAFGHHAWATIGLIDTCSGLSPEQLAATVPGTFGSIVDSLSHLVGADCSYLALLAGDEASAFDESTSLDEMRAVMKQNAERWEAVLERRLDPDLVLVRHRDDGSASHAPVGIRLAQALHHGSDHRSQICTILTSIGIEPPDIDVWAFAWSDGRLVEVPPQS